MRIQTRMRIHEEWDLFFFSTELVKPSSWRPNKRRIIKNKENKKKNNRRRNKTVENLFATLYKEMFLCTECSIFLNGYNTLFYGTWYCQAMKLQLQLVRRCSSCSCRCGFSCSYIYIRSCFAWPTGCELFKYLLSCVRVMPVKVSQQK